MSARKLILTVLILMGVVFALIFLFLVLSWWLGHQ